MKLKDLLTGSRYILLKGSLETDIKGIVYDSRKVQPGDMFICISGTQVDAHELIPQALEKGAAAVVVEKAVEAVPGDYALVRTESTREALAAISAACFSHPAKEMVMIGVTGTKGKTTTTHMIKAILEAAGKKVGLIGTNGIYYNGERLPSVNTTPESYDLQASFRRMSDAGCKYLVMEASSQGIMMHRVSGFTFDYGVFTNLTPDHIGAGEHSSFEEYRMYKSKLFTMCSHGIGNCDDENWKEVIKNRTCDITTFGINTEACDYHAENIHFVAKDKHMGVAFDVKGKCDISVNVGIPGLFNVYNALAAISVCREMGINEDAIKDALLKIQVDGRMELVYTSDEFTVIVDYAHNRVSMESLLNTLRDYAPERLVCVFGCGGNRAKERRYGMGEAGGNTADLCILTEDNSRYEDVLDIIADIEIGIAKTDGQYIVIPDRRKAIFHSIKNAKKGDLIVIIGKGHEDYQETKGVRRPFLDKAVALEALAERKGKQ